MTLELAPAGRLREILSDLIYAWVWSSANGVWSRGESSFL
jgi:hypothetical protein